MSYGGVSPRKRGRALSGATSLVTAPPSAAGAFPNFVNHGGPILRTPRIFTSFWGASWQSDPAHQTGASRLQQFCVDLLASEFMNVLSQYGVGMGKGSGTYAGTSTLAQVATQLNDSGVRSTIQSAVDDGTIPEPPSNNATDALIVFLDESIEIKDAAAGLVLCEPSGDTAFGYHDFFTTTKGNSLYYAVIPALDDSCVRETCPQGDSTCSLSISATQEQRRTQVTSHEFAEMSTDPQLNAWYDLGNGENGDICNGETDSLVVGANVWTVQRIYSKYDDIRTNGATYCVSSAASPEPLQT